MSSTTGPSSSSKDVSFDVEEKEKADHRNDKETGSDIEENITRKFSSASLCSTDGGDDDGDDDDEDDSKNLVMLGPQLALKEQLEMDKDDESLRKWKEQLLAGVDFSQVGENSEPEVKILSLAISYPDRPDLILSIPFIPDSRGYAFALKDGSRYRLLFSFTVSNNIVSGLRYTNTVWKAGVRVENTKVMLGTFSPQKEPYTYELQEEVTPSGIFARGSYSARTKFVDDDGKCYLDLSYYFEIRKEWPLSS